MVSLHLLGWVNSLSGPHETEEVEPSQCCLERPEAGWNRPAATQTGPQEKLLDWARETGEKHIENNSDTVVAHACTAAVITTHTPSTHHMPPLLHRNAPAPGLRPRPDPAAALPRPGGRSGMRSTVASPHPSSVLIHHRPETASITTQQVHIHGPYITCTPCLHLLAPHTHDTP